MRLARVAAVIGVATVIVVGWLLLRPLLLSVLPAWLGGPGVTYYVSPSGQDTAAGTSPSAAWRTLARAGRASLRPGDRLLFQAGHSYRGQLVISADEAGDARRPVVIGSFGTGRATLIAAGSAIRITSTGGVTISNLVLAGQGAPRPGTAGIQAYRDLASGMSAGLTFAHLDISGFGAGIAIGAAQAGAGFRDVRVSDCDLHGNLDAGFDSYGPPFSQSAPGYASAAITLIRVRAYANLGDPANTTTSSGSGIVLGSVQGGSVTQSQAYDNGGRGGDRIKGPVGIWAYDSTGIVFAHDVAYGNRTASRVDGGGFGLDQNTTGSVMEYDLARGNHGPGFLLYAPPRTAAQSGNTIRFNISQGDGQGSATLGGIAVSGRVNDAAVYQNTVVMAGPGSQVALKLSGPLSGIKILNNIFVAAPGGPLIANLSPVPGAGVLLAGNDYAAPAGPWLARWGQAQYPSLPSWRAGTGQERIRGRPTGLDATPGFAGSDFALAPGSPLIRAGLDLRTGFGLRPGPVTYSGAPYDAAAPSIGAQ